MTSAGVLFVDQDDRGKAEQAVAPYFFGDLNLDQIVNAITAGRDEYNLKPFYWFPLRDDDAIRYRHEVFHDLENTALSDQVRAFTQRMREVRESLAQGSKLHYKLQKQSWFLDAVENYTAAIRQFAADLSQSRITSRALIAFRQYLISYVSGEPFGLLVRETGTLKQALAEVRYTVLIKDNAFTVYHYDAESDYSAEIEKTFDKFKQGAAKDYKVAYRSSVEMNHIEAKVAEFVANLNASLFDGLAAFCARYSNFIDEVVATFDQEIQFYLAYIDHAAKLQADGLRFCYPRITTASKEVFAKAAFDLALADKLGGTQARVVCNDFFVRGVERIIVVSGPNQGGKTTFARMVGQLHYLACIGCPVPGQEAQLFLVDQIFAHFEREENVKDLRGKLEDDLVRVHAILDRASSRSLIVLNEVFTSTTLQDELFLSRKVMEALIARDLLCVWVTFVDELASFDEHTVSMVSTIARHNAALRTFKIVRQRADGLAYAMAIVEKYDLTRERILERIPS
jgi:DNA mismatch repair protein MutS